MFEALPRHTVSMCGSGKKRNFQTNLVCICEKKIPQTHLPEVGRRIRHYWTVAVKVPIVPPSSQAK